MALAVASAALVAACGGGGDPKPTPTPEATATPAGPVEKTAGDILDENKTSVVKIDTTTPYGEGGGSGIVWQTDNQVLTNAHVVLGAGAIKVVDPADSTRSFPARVVALSPCDDVALLSVERATGLTPAKIGNSDEVAAGDPVIALGFPATLSAGPAVPIITEGTVSRVRATFEYWGYRDLIQNTAPINPGNSGGPLFNKFGEVVGLNTFTAIGSQSENYAITSNEAVTLGQQLKAGKHIDYIGITLEPNNEQLAFDLDLPYVNGLVVTAVDPGSPADKASPAPLDFGYQVFAVNDTPVDTIGDFCDIIRSQQSGSTLRIQFGYWGDDGNAYDDFIYDVVLP
jgi:S1-C subfamily serine protease